MIHKYKMEFDSAVSQFAFFLWYFTLENHFIVTLVSVVPPAYFSIYLIKKFLVFLIINLLGKLEDDFILNSAF